MDKQMAGLVETIESAAKKPDWAELRQGWYKLYRYAKETGAPIDDRTSFRLLELMHEVGAFDKMAARSEVDSDALIDKVIEAARALATGKGTPQALDSAADDLDRFVTRIGYKLEEEDCARLLTELRNARAWPTLTRLAERMLALGDDYPIVRRLYAQSLIDRGQIQAAIPLLEQLRAGLDKTHPEHLEAAGLLGRARKQVYVSSRGEGRPAAPLQDALRNAISDYASGFEAARPATTPWHAVNLIALQRRAELDGIETPLAGRSEDIAKRLIASLSPTAARSEDPWTAATLAESHLATGDYEAAASWFGIYARHPRVTAFHLGGTVRQLREIWGIKPGEDAAGRILLALDLRLVNMQGGSVALKPMEFQAERTAAETLKGRAYDPVFEAVLGKDHAMPLRWYATGLERAQSVARLVSQAGNPVGTGFLVRGGDIAASLGDRPLLLTNYHVLNRHGDRRALTERNARIEFEAALGSTKAAPRTFGCKQIVWESPDSQLDAALIELDPRPDGIAPCPLASGEPRVGETRIFVIGHPGGRERSIALTDNELLQCGSRPPNSPFRYLHYRTPTEPGNSGSPVFEYKDWEVIGLHHAGPNPESGVFQKLDGAAGEHRANEGVSIQSIRQMASKELGGRRRR